MAAVNIIDAVVFSSLKVLGPYLGFNPGDSLEVSKELWADVYASVHDTNSVFDAVFINAAAAGIANNENATGSIVTAVTASDGFFTSVATGISLDENATGSIASAVAVSDGFADAIADQIKADNVTDAADGTISPIAATYGDLAEARTSVNTLASEVNTDIGNVRGTLNTVLAALKAAGLMTADQ